MSECHHWIAQLQRCYAELHTLRQKLHKLEGKHIDTSGVDDLREEEKTGRGGRRRLKTRRRMARRKKKRTYRRRHGGTARRGIKKRIMTPRSVARQMSPYPMVATVMTEARRRRS